MATKNPYQILGIAPTASQDEIKNAYRNLAKQFHPDLNPGNKQAESKFKGITDAYERIGTPENRAKFDRGELEESQPGAGRNRSYKHTQESPQGTGRYTFTFEEGLDEDLFESLFGARGKTSSQHLRGEDQYYKMTITLRESVLGTEREITLPTGKRLIAKIPAGIKPGARLKFSKQGSPGTLGGPPGDAYVDIQILEDKQFKREGNNLLINLPISITEAIFGAEVKTPTIDGEVLLKIPPRSNTGRKLKLSGKGCMDPHTLQRGDQIVILNVMLPESVDPELESALQAWQTRHSYNPRERKAA